RNFATQGSTFRVSGCLGSLIARGKLKSNFAHVVHHQVGREMPAGLRDELSQEVRAVLCEEFGGLSAFHRLLQNFFANLEFARALFCLGFFTQKTDWGLKYRTTAFGALAHRFKTSEVDFGWWLFFGGPFSRPLLRFGRAWLKLKGDSPVLRNEEGFER